MRHIPAMVGYLIIAFILALLQYPLTGIYGYIMFWPIWFLLMVGYVVYQIDNNENSSKVLKK